MIGTLVSAEETSSQVEVAFTHALDAEGLWDAADTRATDALVTALCSGDRDTVTTAVERRQLPLLLAISDPERLGRGRWPASRQFDRRWAGPSTASANGRPAAAAPRPLCPPAERNSWTLRPVSMGVKVSGIASDKALRGGYQPGSKPSPPPSRRRRLPRMRL